jgi:hypothetical protein
MTSKFMVRSALIVLVLGVFTATASAQRAEVYPNAGGFWPDKFNYGQLKTDGVYGLKGGVFLDQNVEIEGGIGYINHFEMRNPANALNPTFGIFQPAVYGVMYDVNGAYNFGQRQFLNTRVSPYVTLGVGGLTANVRHASSTAITGGGFVMDANGNAVANPARSIVMNDGDTFLTINYGGGIKAMNLWGPVGLRADIRGRTLPNFYGETTNWPELTGGLTFSWGER